MLSPFCPWLRVHDVPWQRLMPHGFGDHDPVVVELQAKSGGEVASMRSVRVKHIVCLIRFNCCNGTEDLGVAGRFFQKNGKASAKFFSAFVWPLLCCFFLFRSVSNVFYLPVCFRRIKVKLMLFEISSERSSSTFDFGLGLLGFLRPNCLLRTRSCFVGVLGAGSCRCSHNKERSYCKPPY